MDEGLLSISPASCGHLVNMLITLEPRGIFGSNIANLYIIRLYLVYQISNIIIINNKKYVTLNNFNYLIHKSQETIS